VLSSDSSGSSLTGKMAVQLYKKYLIYKIKEVLYTKQYINTVLIKPQQIKGAGHEQKETGKRTHGFTGTLPGHCGLDQHPYMADRH
jgi:hypothetical protein